MSVGRKKLSVCQNYVAAFSCCGKVLSVGFIFLLGLDKMLRSVFLLVFSTGVSCTLLSGLLVCVLEFNGTMCSRFLLTNLVGVCT